MVNRIIIGDVLDGLRELPDGCVQCCVTSPPYWGLRDYGADGQIGLEATPEAFVSVMKAFPDLRLVLAHMGGGSWRQLPEFAEAHPNAYYDICEIIEWTGAPMAPTDLDLAKLILKVGVERVMMGSDFPWYSILHTVERVNELPLLTDEQKTLILGGNALDFLG